MQALGSASDEYARILDLVGRYAIARPDVAFSCKKQVGDARACKLPRFAVCGNCLIW